MKVGLTGGSGFIGRHIESALRSVSGGIKISLFDRPQGDILTGEAVKKFVSGKDVIIHAAAVNRGTDIEIISASVVGTYNLIKAVEGLKKKPKIIFLSSIQSGNGTVYGSSKRLAEMMLEDHAKRHNAPVTVFRLTNVFGEGSRPFYNTVVATFCYQVAHGQKITLNPESRNRSLDLLYVGDAAAMIAKEAVRKRRQSYYLKTLSSHSEITVGRLAALIFSFGSGSKKEKALSGLERKLHQTYKYFENGK